MYSSGREQRGNSIICTPSLPAISPPALALITLTQTPRPHSSACVTSTLPCLSFPSQRALPARPFYTSLSHCDLLMLLLTRLDLPVPAPFQSVSWPVSQSGQPEIHQSVFLIHFVCTFDLYFSSLSLIEVLL